MATRLHRFQPSSDEFIVYQTTSETRIISTHLLSLTLSRSLLHRLLLVRRPSACCCTEEMHRRTPVSPHRRMDRHVADVHRLKCSFGTFLRCSVHQHRPLSPQHRHRTGQHWDMFISLTGLFCSFLLSWKLCVPRRSDLLEAHKPPVPAAFR